MSPFDIVNVINTKKEHDHAEMVSGYVPFIVNRAMSNFSDCVFYANEVNQLHFLDKDQQFDFYKYIVPKGKRFAKWNKAEKSSQDILMLQEYYNINIRVAEQYLHILTDEQMEYIRSKTNRGGVK